MTEQKSMKLENNPFGRSNQERRVEDRGPVEGHERRTNDTDRRMENNLQFVTFRLGKQLLGLPVALVEEISLAQRLTKIPLAPPSVSGLLNLRGSVVTCIDLRIRLGLPEITTEEAMHIIVQYEGELFSLKVDQIGDVLLVGKSRFAHPPSTLDQIWQDCCSGVYRLAAELLVVLELKKILIVT